MKLRRVMVVAPIRSRMAPKSGKERASSTIRAMTESLKTTLVRLNSARLIHFKHPHSTFFTRNHPNHYRNRRPELPRRRPTQSGLENVSVFFLYLRMYFYAYIIHIKYML